MRALVVKRKRVLHGPLRHRRIKPRPEQSLPGKAAASTRLRRLLKQGTAPAETTGYGHIVVERQQGRVLNLGANRWENDIQLDWTQGISAVARDESRSGGTAPAVATAKKGAAGAPSLPSHLVAAPSQPGNNARRSVIRQAIQAWIVKNAVQLRPGEPLRVAHNGPSPQCRPPCLSHAGGDCVRLSEQGCQFVVRNSRVTTARLRPGRASLHRRCLMTAPKVWVLHPSAGTGDPRWPR